jgi:prepilin-type N-terminal cleavage/methylation domain-containing protein/prepilin-type processing-associated H-X9-DG protein
MTLMRRRNGFTLVELLVVIGIIAVLIGILLPALNKARANARHVKSCSDLRQLLLGYTMYHQENRGSLLWGYPPATVNGSLISVTHEQSGLVLTVPIADRYPWRLLPYVSNVWGIVHAHDQVPPIPTTNDMAGWLQAYQLSLSPTFGINAIFVGGHKDYGGFIGDRLNTGKHVAFKATEIRRSTEQIIFADSKAFTFQKWDGTGLHYLTPPRANGLNWTVSADEKFNVLSTNIQGIPQGWFTNRTAVGFFDGHVDSMLPSQLTNMRLWAPKAETADYDYP